MSRNIHIHPRWIFAFLCAMSMCVLAYAYFAEYVQGYKPCTLCYYERGASWIVFGLSFFGFLTCNQFLVRLATFGMICLVFIANLGISFYHVGLEQGWWVDHEICQAKLPDTDNLEELRKSIAATEASDCSVAQWHLFGLSMSFYDFLYSLLLLILSGFGFWHSWSTRK